MQSEEVNGSNSDGVKKVDGSPPSSFRKEKRGGDMAMQHAQSSIGFGLAVLGDVDVSEVSHQLEDIREDGEEMDRSERSQHSQTRGFNIVTETGKDGEEHQFIQLESDVFSMMVISRYTDFCFWYALSIFFFQIGILSMVIVDLLEDDSLTDDGNPFNVPVNVDWQVWVSQILAIVVAAVSHDDARTSMKMIGVKFNTDLVNQYHGASRFKFYIANICRFLEGMVAIVVAFMFIVQSDNTLDIFLNFAAVEFICNLDNLAFELASAGYLGEHARKTAEATEEIQFRLTKGGFKKWAGIGLFYLVVAGLLAGWGVVRARQSNGYLLRQTSCATFKASFGDQVLDLPEGEPVVLDGSYREDRVIDRFQNELDKPPPLFYGYFSGTYIASLDSSGSRFLTKNGRPIYYERGIEDPTSGRFYYCEDELAWVFSIPALGDHIPSKTRTDNCEWGWLVISPQTDVYRLEEVDSPEWDIWTGDDLQPTEGDFSVDCIECERDRDCRLTHGVCNADEGVCECTDGWGGYACQVELPYCSKVEWFLFGDSSADYEVTEPFYLFENMARTSTLVYDRPVYKMNETADEGCSTGAHEELMFYSGRRWFYSSFCTDERKEVLNDDFHAFWDNVLRLNTLKVSAPTTGDSPTEDLEWFNLGQAGAGDGPLGVTKVINDAGVHCLSLDCQQNGICGDYGTCQDGHCICHDWYGGNYCQVNPTGSYASAQYEELQRFMLDYYSGTASGRFVANSYYQKWWEPVLTELEYTHIPARVDIYVDTHSWETGYNISVAETGELVADFPAGSFDEFAFDSVYSHLVFLDPEEIYTFEISDSFGDGIEYDGYAYNLTALYEFAPYQVFSGVGDFGSSASRLFWVNTPSTYPDPSAFVPGTIQVELFFEQRPWEVGYSLALAETGELVADFPAGTFGGTRKAPRADSSRIFYLDPGVGYSFHISDSFGVGVTFSVGAVLSTGAKHILVEGVLPYRSSSATYPFVVPVEDLSNREL